MRLIDADKLRHDMYDAAFIQDSDMQKWDGGCWIRYKMFEKTLEKQDEAIVRCKDCYWWDRSWQLIDTKPELRNCKKLRTLTREDWFCAEGRRDETTLQD